MWASQESWHQQQQHTKKPFKQTLPYTIASNRNNQSTETAKLTARFANRRARYRNGTNMRVVCGFGAGGVMLHCRWHKSGWAKSASAFEQSFWTEYNLFVWAIRWTELLWRIFSAKKSLFLWSNLLLFGVRSYADMSAYTGFRDLIHYHITR